jgi:hypothetical protein
MSPATVHQLHIPQASAPALAATMLDLVGADDALALANIAVLEAQNKQHRAATARRGLLELLADLMEDGESVTMRLQGFEALTATCARGVRGKVVSLARSTIISAPKA